MLISQLFSSLFPTLFCTLFSLTPFLTLLYSHPHSPLYVLPQGGKEHPSTLPRPLASSVPLAMPLLTMDSPVGHTGRVQA